MRIKRIVTAVLVCLLVFSTLTACSSSSKNAVSGSATSVAGSTAAGNTDDLVVTYGLSASWEKLQPFNTTVSGWTGGLVIDKIFDSLVYVDSDGSVEPRNAKEWSISQDGKTITFKLNENARWQDGEKVTAQDWVFTLRTITNPDFVVADLGNYAVLAGTADSGTELSKDSVGAEAPDDYTLVLHLKKSTNLTSFLYTVPRLYHVLPEHLLKDIVPKDLADNAYWQAPVGSGPFKFVSEVSGNTLELSANKDYYLGAPKFGKLVYKVMDPSSFSSALLSGQIDDFYTNISADEAKALDGQNGIVVKKAKNPTGQVGIMLNNQTLNNAKVRLALNLAIDKKLIIDQLYLGDAEASESYIMPTSKYYDKDLPTGRDLEKAKQLLQEGEWDFNTVIILTVPSGIRQKIATIVQQNWKDAGIKSEIQVVDTPALYSGLTKGTVESGITGYSATQDPLYIGDLFSNKRTTFLHISDGQFEDLYSKILVDQDETSRAQLLQEYQQTLYEQQPLINLLHSYNYYCYSSRLGNLNPEDVNYWNENVWDWTVS